MIFTDLRHLCILVSKGRKTMIALGMDPHPGRHTVAALDSSGSLLGSMKVQNTSAGLEQLHKFCIAIYVLSWAIEGAATASWLSRQRTAGAERNHLFRSAESHQSVSLPAAHLRMRHTSWVVS